MSNMSYCRFTNTLGDLTDCQSVLEGLIGTEEGVAALSEEELRAAKELVRTCLEIVRMVGEADGLDVAEDEESERFEGRIDDILNSVNATVEEVQS